MGPVPNEFSVKYVPSWFPFAGFKRQAKIWSNFVHTARDESFNATKRDVVCDIFLTSLSTF